MAAQIEPWYVSGPVIRGFGRGKSLLGIPTANLPACSLTQQHACGIYFGWASLSNRGTFKMVMSLGDNPYYQNAEPTLEAWLLNEFTEDFYGEELRLVITGYIRSQEANFPCKEMLVQKMQEDRQIAEAALDLQQYSVYQSDPYFNGKDRAVFPRLA